MVYTCTDIKPAFILHFQKIRKGKISKRNKEGNVISNNSNLKEKNLN